MDDVRNVWLVWSGDYELAEVIGAYSTLDRAKAAHDGSHDPDWRSNDDQWWCAFRVDAVPAKGGTHAFEVLSIPVVGGVATLPDGRLIPSTAQVVTVPVMPNGLPDIAIRAESCDYRIEAVPLDA